MHITWFGHSAFALESAGRKVLIDPFFTGNPVFEAEGAGTPAEKRAAAIARVSDIVITHGHMDHIGDSLPILAQTGATLFCNWDLGQWVEGKWTARYPDKVLAAELMNTGGTVSRGDVSISLVRADHSSGVFKDGVFQTLGPANGVIVKIPGAPTIYHMGDTDIFGDMALIEELYAPDIVIVPIGDRFTMGPSTAALAVRRYFPRAKAVIPCHFRTFDLLTGTAEAFRHELGPMSLKLLDLTPHEAMTFSI